MHSSTSTQLLVLPSSPITIFLHFRNDFMFSFMYFCYHSNIFFDNDVSNNNDNSIIKWHWSERKENSRAFKEWGKQVGSTQWLMVSFNARISPWSCGCPCPPHTPENHPDSQPRPTVRWTRSWWTDVRLGGFLRRPHPPHVGTRRRYPKSRG